MAVTFNDSVTTLYLVDDRNPIGYAQVLEELAATNATPLRLYTCGSDLLSQRAADGTTHWFGYDGHGSVRYLANSSGAITDRYDYDAWGVPVYTNGTTTNLYRYAGEQFDPDLGLYYLRARYLNPAQGRFIGMDPSFGILENPAEFHEFLYAQGDPVNGSDPTGLENLPTVGIAGSIGAVWLPILLSFRVLSRFSSARPWFTRQSKTESSATWASPTIFHSHPTGNI
jgi:RHS repeat-associated protein